MATTDTTAITEAYREQREREWNAFATSRDPLPDYWAHWDAISFGWRVPVEFIQPLGLESPAAFEALEPLLAKLREMPEVEVAPIPWLHASWVRAGFLMSTDIMWSQVETFYVNAAPRLRRVEPFTVRLEGVSVVDGERIYLGVDDGGSFREARRQAKLGVPKVFEVLKTDPLITPQGDTYMPRVEFGFFTGRGSRERVIEAIEPYRDLVLGEVALTHLKLARLPIQPHSHFEDLDVVAEIPMLGAAHRGGYHN
jgi:hypothetical protein